MAVFDECLSTEQLFHNSFTFIDAILAYIIFIKVLNCFISGANNDFISLIGYIAQVLANLSYPYQISIHRIVQPLFLMLLATAQCLFFVISMISSNCKTWCLNIGLGIYKRTI